METQILSQMPPRDEMPIIVRQNACHLPALKCLNDLQRRSGMNPLTQDCKGWCRLVRAM